MQTLKIKKKYPSPSPSTLPPSDMCICVGYAGSVCAHMCVHAYEVRGWPSAWSPVTFHLIYQGRLSLNLELSGLS